jgi:hypothetical protein
MVEVLVMVVGVAAAENTDIQRWMQGIHALFMELNVDAGLRIVFRIRERFGPHRRAGARRRAVDRSRGGGPRPQLPALRAVDPSPVRPDSHAGQIRGAGFRRRDTPVSTT